MNVSIFGSNGPMFAFDHNAAGKNFIVDAGTNVFTSTDHGLVNGQRIKVNTSGVLPSPLATTTYYYVISATTSSFKISSIRGGTEIDIIDAGTGTHTLYTELFVNLDYWVSLTIEPDIRNIKQESELDADRIILPRGEYLEIFGKINLFKYADLTSRQSKYQEIYEFRNKNVSFWKHRDGSPYKDKDGNEVLFYLESVIPKNLTTLDYRDVLFLRFLSLKGIDYPNSFTIIPTVDEILMSNDY